MTLDEVSVASKNLVGDPILVLRIIPTGLPVGILVEHSAHAGEPGGHSARSEDAEADEQ